MKTPIRKTHEELMEEAKRVQSALQNARDLFKVIGVLTDQKGFTRNQTRQWLMERGYKLELNHITYALKIYRKGFSDAKQGTTESGDPLPPDPLPRIS